MFRQSPGSQFLAMQDQNKGPTAKVILIFWRDVPLSSPRKESKIAKILQPARLVRPKTRNCSPNRRLVRSGTSVSNQLIILVLYSGKMGADRDITVWKAHSHGNGILGSGESNPVFPTGWSPACFRSPRWRGVTVTA